MGEGLRSHDTALEREVAQLRRDVDVLARQGRKSLVGLIQTTNPGKPSDALFPGNLPMIGAYVYDTANGKPWWRYDVDDWRDATGAA